MDCSLMSRLFLEILGPKQRGHREECDATVPKAQRRDHYRMTVQMYMSVTAKPDYQCHVTLRIECYRWKSQYHMQNVGLVPRDEGANFIRGPLTFVRISIKYIFNYLRFRNIGHHLTRLNLGLHPLFLLGCWRRIGICAARGKELCVCLPRHRRCPREIRACRKVRRCSKN